MAAFVMLVHRALLRIYQHSLHVCGHRVSNTATISKAFLR